MAVWPEILSLMVERRPCTYEGCKVAAEEGSNLCILHQPSPDESPKDVERFKAALYAQLDKQGQEDERNQRLWFRGYVFPAAVAVRETRDEKSDRVIALPVRMEKADFRGAKFGVAYFGGAEFEKGARLDFKFGVADFGDAKFREAHFRGAEFERDRKSVV